MIDMQRISAIKLGREKASKLEHKDRIEEQKWNSSIVVNQKYKKCNRTKNQD